MRNIFVFDENKCVGCKACTVACMLENGEQPAGSWRSVQSNNMVHQPDVPVFHLSMACNHCEDSPCLKGCPAKAYHKDEATGAILHDAEKCLGCRYCTWNCPYDAPVFNSQKGIVEKCTFCQARLEKADKPACVLACPTGALEFSHEEFSRNDSIDSTPLPVDVGSGIKVIKRRKKNTPIYVTSLFQYQPKEYRTTEKEKKIDAKKEWPLLVFSLLSAVVVAVFLAGKWNESYAGQSFLIFASLVAGGLTFFHLGKKERAWRSIINLRHSWLSREIFFYGLFFILMLIQFFIFPVPVEISFIFSFIFLFSIDILYRPVQRHWDWPVHSGQTVFIGTGLWLLLSDWPMVFLVYSIFRIAIFDNGRLDSFAVGSVRYRIRIISAVAASLLLFTAENEVYVVLAYLVGEAIDRYDFYEALETPTWNPKLDD